MKPLLLALALLLLLVTAPTPAHAHDPLICVDPGPTHIYDYTIDLPEVCLL